jgi:hypothetical protein
MNGLDFSTNDNDPGLYQNSTFDGPTPSEWSSEGDSSWDRDVLDPALEIGSKVDESGRTDQGLRVCFNCFASESTIWRHGPGWYYLCDSCGYYYQQVCTSKYESYTFDLEILEETR